MSKRVVLKTVQDHINDFSAREYRKEKHRRNMSDSKYIVGDVVRLVDCDKAYEHGREIGLDGESAVYTGNERYDSSYKEGLLEVSPDLIVTIAMVTGKLNGVDWYVAEEEFTGSDTDTDYSIVFTDNDIEGLI